MNVGWWRSCTTATVTDIHHRADSAFGARSRRLRRLDPPPTAFWTNRTLLTTNAHRWPHGRLYNCYYTDVHGWPVWGPMQCGALDQVGCLVRWIRRVRVSYGEIGRRRSLESTSERWQCWQQASVHVGTFTGVATDKLRGQLISLSVYRRKTQWLSAAAENRPKKIRSWPSAKTERLPKQ